MRYDTIIIGGGLSGLCCGIRLQNAGAKCAIISSGGCALFFSSGSFNLLNRLPDGTAVCEPLKAAAQLPANHPYQKIGMEQLAAYTNEVPAFFEKCGVKLEGSSEHNSVRTSPIGIECPVWLTFAADQIKEEDKNPGASLFASLKTTFCGLGGEFFFGDRVSTGKIEEGKVQYVSTESLGDVELKADNFVLASGSFMSRGLESVQNRIFEPVFGLDLDIDEDRSAWYGTKFFDQQGFIGYGVATDNEFRARKDGQTIANLYAIGSVIGGYDALQEGCGAGVAILSALKVADTISKK